VQQELVPKAAVLRQNGRDRRCLRQTGLVRIAVHFAVGKGRRGEDRRAVAQ